MNHDPIPCAMCARFTIAGHDEQAAQGNGWCEGYERYVRWDDRWCVLFKPAKDERRRKAWMEKQKPTETNLRASA